MSERRHVIELAALSSEEITRILDLADPFRTSGKER